MISIHHLRGTAIMGHNTKIPPQLVCTLQLTLIMLTRTRRTPITQEAHINQNHITRLNIPLNRKNLIYRATSR